MVGMVSKHLIGQLNLRFPCFEFPSEVRFLLLFMRDVTDRETVRSGWLSF